MTYRLYAMTEADREALNRLNATLATGISAALAADDDTNSGEGAVLIGLPSFYELGMSHSVRLFLTTRKIGPSRQYCWVGATVEEACKKAQRKVEQWLREL